MRMTITWHNNNPNTVWNKLAARLGREPTNAEAASEVQRILSEASTARPDRNIQKRRNH